MTDQQKGMTISLIIDWENNDKCIELLISNNQLVIINSFMKWFKAEEEEFTPKSGEWMMEKCILDKLLREIVDKCD